MVPRRRARKRKTLCASLTCSGSRLRRTMMADDGTFCESEPRGSSRLVRWTGWKKLYRLWDILISSYHTTAIQYVLEYVPRLRRSKWFLYPDFQKFAGKIFADLGQSMVAESVSANFSANFSRESGSPRIFHAKFLRVMFSANFSRDFFAHNVFREFLTRHFHVQSLPRIFHAIFSRVMFSAIFSRDCFAHNVFPRIFHATFSRVSFSAIFSAVRDVMVLTNKHLDGKSIPAVYRHA